MIVLGVGQTGLVRLMAGERRPRPAGPRAPGSVGSPSTPPAASRR